MCFRVPSRTQYELDVALLHSHNGLCLPLPRHLAYYIVIFSLLHYIALGRKVDTSLFNFASQLLAQCLTHGKLQQIHIEHMNELITFFNCQFLQNSNIWERMVGLFLKCCILFGLITFFMSHLCGIKNFTWDFRNLYKKHWRVLNSHRNWVSTYVVSVEPGVLFLIIDDEVPVVFLCPYINSPGSLGRNKNYHNAHF